MAKLDRDELIAQFQKNVDKVDKKLNGEKGLLARREALATRLANLDETITKVKAEKAEAERGVEWAKSAPGTDNAAPAAADDSFGSATTAPEDGDEGEPEQDGQTFTV